MFLTETRFWIIFLICCAYILAIKLLLKPQRTAGIFAEPSSKISAYLFLPLKALDHSVKYNKIIKPYYFSFISSISNKLKAKYILKFMVIFNIIPRSLLALILLFDIFWFNTLELFYKCILLGLFPFIVKYYKYSLEDIIEQFIVELETKYSIVRIFEEDFEYDFGKKDNTEAIWHFEAVSIRKYIKIKFENHYLWLDDEVTYRYVATPFCTETFYEQFALKKYGNKDAKITLEDQEYLEKDFHNIMEQILTLLLHQDAFYHYLENKKIKYAKMIISILYLSLWLFILCISYYYFPIKLEILNMLFIVLNKIIKYENPFDIAG